MPHFLLNDKLKVYSVPGNFGALLCSTWQMCSENNLNNLGYMKNINFGQTLCKFIIMS